MIKQDLSIELISKPRRFKTPEGTILITDFRTGGNEYIGRIAAYPNAEPPVVEVAFTVPMDKEPYRKTYRSPDEAVMRPNLDWLAREVITEAIKVPGQI